MESEIKCKHSHFYHEPQIQTESGKKLIILPLMRDRDKRTYFIGICIGIGPHCKWTITLNYAIYSTIGDPNYLQYRRWIPTFYTMIPRYNDRQVNNCAGSQVDDGSTRQIWNAWAHVNPWHRKRVSDPSRVAHHWHNTLMDICFFFLSDRKKPGKAFNRVELKRDSRRTLATIRKVVRGNRYRKDLKMVRGRYHEL